jgi:hypothetical protein
MSDDELMAQFEATMKTLQAGQRVEGDKEPLVLPSAPTTD